MARFAILHASDLHFHRREKTIGLPDLLPALVGGEFVRPGVDFVSSDDVNVAEALAQFAFVNRAGLDAIVVSGDLATTGEVDDLGIALDFVAGAAVGGDYHTSGGFPTLSAAGRPVVVLPGNHDRFGPLWRFYAAGDTDFDGIFGRFWGVGQGAQHLWTGMRGGAAVALIGADFCVEPGGDAGLPLLGHLGRGHVVREVTEPLVQLTREAKAEMPGCVVVWVIHFEPEAEEDSLALFDPEGLLRGAIEEAEPAAMLCGHTHLVSRETDFAGAPVFVCGTSAQWYAPKGNYLQVIEIEADPSGSTPPELGLRAFRYQRRDGQYGFF